jgi:hypothetical protein
LPGVGLNGGGEIATIGTGCIVLNSKAGRILNFLKGGSSMKYFLRRFFAIMAIGFGALLIDGCGSGDDGPTTDPQSGRVEKEIGPEGGTVEVADSNNPLNGVKVTIPAGAVAQKTKISIEGGANAPGYPVGLSNDHPAVKFASGTSFLTDVEITFPVTYIPTSDQDILGVYYYNPAKAKWIIIPARKVSENKLTIRTTNFGLCSWGTVRLSQVDNDTIIASMEDTQTMFDAWNQLIAALNTKIQPITSAMQNPANFAKCSTQNNILSLLSSWRQEALQGVTNYLATPAVQNNCRMCSLVTGVCTPYTCDPNQVISGQPIEWLRQEAGIWLSEMIWSASCPVDLLGPLAGKLMALAKYSAAVYDLKCDWRCILKSGNLDFYSNLLLGNVCTFTIFGIEYYRSITPCQ